MNQAGRPNFRGQNQNYARRVLRAAAKKKAPGKSPGAFWSCELQNFYCVDRSICVMLIVLMLRNIGVCGGNRFGVKN
jgi:hypothetical protein